MRRYTSFVLGLSFVLAVALAGCGGDDTSRADIAFVSSRDGDYAVLVMAADGGGQRRLTAATDESGGENPFFQIDPAWSPDATRIAFVSGRAGSSDVYVMGADGDGTKRLTSTKANDTHPTWSADGAAIAFARAGDNYVMGADGTNQRRLTDNRAHDGFPTWSPDGAHIAFMSQRRWEL